MRGETPGEISPRSIDRFRLTGRTIPLDRRVHAIRRDIADIALAAQHFAPHYARAENRICSRPSTPILAEPDGGSIAVSQLLYGEGFAVLDLSADWAWGYSTHDNYVGYVRTDALGPQQEPTHVVTALSALLFSKPDIKAPVRSTLPIGALLSGEEEGSFLATSQGHVHLRHILPVDVPLPDPVAIAETLIGQPYRWGGRGDGGIDCSGLVQLCLGLCGTEMPRDSDMQRMLGHAIHPGKALERGDLIFFPGHVGFMADDTYIVHANAYWMMVTKEKLDDVVQRLKPDYENPILTRRRLHHHDH